MAQLDDLQAYVNFELPRRAAFLNNANTSYDGDPNDGGAPAIIQGAPLGTLFREETAEKWWRKAESLWEDLGAGGGAGTASETSGTIVLAVNGGTGSDTPTETRPARITSGDHSAEPFATIQAAIDTIPPVILHQVTVDVAAGNYTGFDVRNRIVGTTGLRTNLLTIRGTREAATLATGPNSGTATGGDDRSVVFTGAAWTADDLVGRYVEITSGAGAGNILLVSENTTDTIKFAGYGATMGAGSVFEIQDITSKITTPKTQGSFTVGIYVDAIIGTMQIEDFFHDVYAIVGVMAINCSGALPSFRRVISKDAYYGVLAQDCDRVGFAELGVIDSVNIGLYFIATMTPANQSGGWLIKGAGAQSIKMDGVIWAIPLGIHIRDGANKGVEVFRGQNVAFYRMIIDNVTTGIQSWYCTGLELDTCEIKNVTVGPFSLWATFLYLNGLVGAGNAGWGLYAFGNNNYVALNPTPTITGASGEVTVDGTNDVTWANLANSGDYARDIETGSHIRRH